MSLYRGAGGASDATDDSTVNAVAGYASSAASSATSAANSATAASTSASSAATSASGASTSASSVATNATNAASSASAANTYATQASNSKDAAAASATIASTRAGEASSSASNASSSAATATTKAGESTTSATASAASAVSSAASAASALAIYGNTAAVNAAVAAAAASATTSTTQAANSAASAGDAADSESLAFEHEQNAAEWATVAQGSANSAQGYSTAALAARDATLAAYDSFDDRYLGVKNADPTLDNDGNTLLAGSLYFNSTTNMMMLRAGNAWVAAYTSGGSPSFGNTVVNGTLGVTGATTLSAGTTNGVTYLNGSKVLTSGSALTFDGTKLTNTGSAGGVRLEIVSTGSSPELSITSANTGTSQINFGGATTPKKGVFRYSDNSDLFVWLLNSTTEQMRLTSTGLGLANGTFLAFSNAPSASSFALYGSTTTTVLNGPSGGVVQFNIANAEQMRLTSTGLGIGTSSPAYKLHVSGSGAQAVQVTSTSASASLILQNFTGSGNYAYIQYSGHLGSGLQFYDTANVAARMTLDSSGNLGIGTSSPAQKLHVNGPTSNGALSPVFQGTQGGSGAGTGASIRLGFGATTGAWCEVGGAYDGSAGSYLTFATPPNLSTNAIERMRLDSSGNLGLGVTPSAWGSAFKAIQVKGAVLSAFGDRDSYQGTNWYYTVGGSYAYQTTGFATQYVQDVGRHLWFIAPSGTAGAAITFTQAMTLNAAGNFLVGTTTDEGERTRFESTSAAQLSLVYTGIGKFSFKVDSGRNLSILDGTTERARIDSSGNFMVGATSALGRATIVQGATSNADTLILKSPNAAGAGSQAGIRFLRDTNAVLAQILADTNTGALITSVNGAERARIDSSGNSIQSAPATAPTLATNGTMVFNLTSNTNLRVSVRGSDGVTRTANLTLA